MEGIRLRSDSTGSAKSAFYQGTIVSTASKANEGGAANESVSKNNWLRRGTRNGGHQKDRRLPPTKKQCGRESFDIGQLGNAVHGSVFPDVGPEVSSPPPVSPFAPPSGYYCQDPQMYGLERHSILPQTDFALPDGGRHETVSDRSSQSFNDFSKENRFPSKMLSTRKLEKGSHPTHNFLEECPSMDDTELQGMSLDLEHSPISSPNKSGMLFDDLGFQSWQNRSFLPQVGAHVQHRESHAHFSQYGSLQQHPSYGTNPSLNIFKESLQGAGEEFHSCSRPVRGSDSDDKNGRFDFISNFVELSNWLITSFGSDEGGSPQSEESTHTSFLTFLRLVLYNPVYPEFTSLQQFSWAVILGILMGILTAVWKKVIEFCVEFVWKTIPETLLGWGIFSDLDGVFPVYHYMWITPSFFGGVLSYIFAALPTPIPGQNDWIHSLHSRGVQDSSTFGLLLLLSTAGMASGLSLGPELPLILTAGMIGSSLGVLCKQSILSARVLNLTAASAAIGGFFGFPMAGALFVLEVPHRMGLQYFEALSPATIASIVAVLTNRLVTGNDVTGYYQYPFLNETLPSSIFHDAIAFGLFGGVLGIFYTRIVLILKSFVHSLFQKQQGGSNQKNYKDLTHVTECTDETSRLVDEPEIGTPTRKEKKVLGFPLKIHERFSFVGIDHEPTRAGLVGAIIGVVVGVICMFLPHVMFWGESQLQNLIDKGRTPLPVFGQRDELSGGLVSLGLCMVENNGDDTKFGFSLGCSAAIALAKIFVTGLSLGTGIVGGHFWAPLFVGCAASHFLTDSVAALSTFLNMSISLSTYPCVAILCIMGSCHVVVFRAHIAVILILTLTIDAFDPKNGVGGAFRVAGDYSAVFPLLTVAVFCALQISRHTIFYEKQRSRGDIMALPEVLCEPGKEGRPLVMDYDGKLHELDESDYEYEADSQGSFDENFAYRTSDDSGATQYDIEAHFHAKAQQMQPYSSLCATDSSTMSRTLPPRPQEVKPPRSPLSKANAFAMRSDHNGNSVCMPAPDDSPNTSSAYVSSSNDSMEAPRSTPSCTGKKTHRRTRSEPFYDTMKLNTTFGIGRASHERIGSGNVTPPPMAKVPVALKRISSFGEVDQEQPSLLDQARKRAASYVSAEKTNITQNRSNPMATVSPKIMNRKGSL